MLHIHDAIPELAGQVCEALLVQGHYYRGRPEDDAPVLLLKLRGGAWHRIFIQAGVLFWQTVEAPDSPDHDRHYYVVTDLGAAHHLSGAHLARVSTANLGQGDGLRLTFGDARRVDLRYRDGRSWVTVGGPGR